MAPSLYFLHETKRKTCKTSIQILPCVTHVGVPDFFQDYAPESNGSHTPMWTLTDPSGSNQLFLDVLVGEVCILTLKNMMWCREMAIAQPLFCPAWTSVNEFHFIQDLSPYIFEIN